MIPAITLQKVPREILSSYGKDGRTGGPRANLQVLADASKGVAAPDVIPALLALHEAVTKAGGDFRITELHRDLAVQKAMRARYDHWVASGKPKPGTSGFDSKTMKSDFVALPGRSNHNGGRAIDFHVGMLNFPGVTPDKQLDKMWEICIPLGWTPIIKSASESASESWHLDYFGELQGVFKRLGYEQGALCGAILVGHGDLSGYEATIQALLCRAGFDIGKIDGVIGPKTKAAISSALSITPEAVASRLASKDVALLSQLQELHPK